MNILFATTNPNKVSRVKKIFKETNVKLMSLADLDYKIEEPEENGKNGVENAIIKAKYYYSQLKVKTPVLTQDDTLFLANVKESDNPKKDIKLPVVKKYGEFTDELAYKYYLDLVKKYNKEYLDMEFRYGHAICGENFCEGSASTLSGRLCAQINFTRTPGYFLADMMKVNINGIWRYCSDLDEEELIEQDKDFKRSINRLIKRFLAKYPTNLIPTNDHAHQILLH